VRVLGIGDSDSYVKWGAATLDRMPAEWDTELVLLKTPAMPSANQLAAALRGTRFEGTQPESVGLAELAAKVATDEPTIVLISVRGPVVRVLVRAIVAAAERRPVLVSGMPGISIPETMLAVYYRSQIDVFVLHSKREVRAFRELARSLGVEQDFALATLPFLAGDEPVVPSGTDIVFAPQAKVPRVQAEREWLVGRLVAAAKALPGRRLVVKVRGLASEPQTHPESFPLDVALAARTDVPDNLVVETGAMSDALAKAGALVTVSSTAAMEAMARGIPVIALDDFGVTDRLINTVFEGSGLLVGTDALIAGEFRNPNPDWLDDNYFHAPEAETWVQAIDAAVARREAGPFPLRPQFRGRLGGSFRRAWDRKRALGPYDDSLAGHAAMLVGTPLRQGIRRVRKVRARIRRSRV
jgi:hypothetical protein